MGLDSFFGGAAESGRVPATQDSRFLHYAGQERPAPVEMTDFRRCRIVSRFPTFGLYCFRALQLSRFAEGIALVDGSANV